jgi:hypothetical protein
MPRVYKRLVLMAISIASALHAQAPAAAPAETHPAAEIPAAKPRTAAQAM